MEQLGTEKKIFGWGRYELFLVVIFFIVWGFVYLDRLTLSYLAPIVMEELKFNTVQYSLMGTATSFCLAISAFIFGAISDSSGYRKKWLVPFAFGVGVFGGLCAFSHSFVAFIICRGLVGFCEGPVLALMIAMVAKESSPQRLALNTALVSLGACIIGGVLGPILTTQLTAAFSWRFAFMAAAVPTLIVAIIMAKFVHEIHFEPTKDSSGKKESAFTYFGKIMKYRNVLICLLVGIFGMAGYWTLMLYSSLFFTSVGGMALTKFGYIFSVMAAVSILWQVIIPKVTDYSGRKPGLILWLALASLAPIFMFFMPTSSASVVAYILFTGICFSIPIIFWFVVPTETLPENLIGSSGGMLMGVSEIIGGAIWPAIGGVIITNQGLPVIMLWGAICFWICVILCFGLRETLTKERRLAIKEEKRAKKADKAAKTA